MGTYFAKKGEINKDWYLIDATDLILGRLSTKIAMMLMGKNKPTYTPNVDTGDTIVVINCEKIKLTGKKLEQKFLHSHSGYPGGLKSVRYDKLIKEKPERIIYYAVKGMLPKNKLRDKYLKKLYIYKGSEHPHIAQNPEVLKLED